MAYGRLVASSWPQLVLQQLKQSAVRKAIWELRHQQVLTEVLSRLDHAGIRPVLLKGTALAYSLYPNPALRERGDTDLLVPFEAKTETDAVLVALGFRKNRGITGELVSYQANYSVGESGLSEHTLDVHWKVNNSQLLSRLFTHSELLLTSVSLPRLAPAANRPSHVHALLLACMHRCTHKQNPYYVNGEAHHEPNRLIWLYDIHLIAGALVQPEWDAFLALASDKGLTSVCLEGMSQAQERFFTVYPEGVLERLTRVTTAEAPARYLSGGKLRQQWLDFCALEDHSRRAQLVRETLFPPAAYLREKYIHDRVSWLPWLYLKRAAHGVMKRMH